MTGNTVTLLTGSGTDEIAVGANQVPTANTLEISNTELDTISATSIVFGDTTTQSGNIILGRDHVVAQGTKNLQFLTSGDIAVAGFDLTGNTVTLGSTAALPRVDQITRTGAGTLNAAADLNLYAINGIGSVSGNGILVGTVGGALSATNTTSGDLYLQTTASVTLGVAGISLQQQANLGELRVDSTGTITIGGDLTSGQAGNGTITLNPTGALIRTNGTLTADGINLGTDNNATSIGATGAGAIRIAGSTTNPFVRARADSGGIFINQVAGDILTANYHLDVPGIGQSIELSTTDGHITVTTRTSSPCGS